MLVSAGADINMRLLLVTCYNLIVNVMIRADRAKTPLDIARERGHYEVIRYLQFTHQNRQTLEHLNLGMLTLSFQIPAYIKSQLITKDCKKSPRSNHWNSRGWGSINCWTNFRINWWGWWVWAREKDRAWRIPWWSQTSTKDVYRTKGIGGRFNDKIL